MPEMRFIETRADQARVLLCRWVEHLAERGERVQVAAETGASAEVLDGLLWTFGDGSFVAHRIAGGEHAHFGPEAVLITAGAGALPGATALVFEGEADLEAASRVPLSLHFVARDDEAKTAASRALWQAAKDAGFTLRHVPASANAPH